MIGTVSILVFAFAILAWMWWFELRLSRTLDMAEGTCDQADRALGWITEKAAPAIERVAALAPELADALVTHRTVLETLPLWMRREFTEPPVVIEAEEMPVTDPEPKTEPNPAVRPRPMPGPRTKPDGLPANGGVKRARLTATSDVDRATSEAGREPDVEYAHVLARLEDQMFEWRQFSASMEGTK